MDDARFIPLTQSQFAIVDAADYEWLNQWKWYAYWSSNTKSFYAARDVWDGERCHHIRMHRHILGLPQESKLQGDHKNPDRTLDNRRENLRIATPLENVRNRRRQSNNKCGFKGVSWHKDTKLFRAQIKIGGKQITLGRRKTAEEAYALYCEAAKLHFGEFARLA